MKVAGFSFIRNAVKYQYPIREALQSILPLCDELVVAVGNSDDGTRELVASLDRRIRVIDTVWDDSQKKGGRVLALETDKALRALPADADWCIYIQGDEVLHEDGYAAIREAMRQWKDDRKVDGLLLKYRHFYGSFDYVGTSSAWYRNEIRVIRNDPSIYSYKDAQGFRKGANRKLRVKAVDAWVHHYGWVREPSVMNAKQYNFAGLYIGGEAHYGALQQVYSVPFDYSVVDALERFRGTHPRVMQERIRQMNWAFDHDLSRNRLPAKEKFKNWVERLTGRRPFDHNNYRLV